VRSCGVNRAKVVLVRAGVGKSDECKRRTELQAWDSAGKTNLHSEYRCGGCGAALTASQSAEHKGIALSGALRRRELGGDKENRKNNALSTELHSVRVAL
jgi:hypothetical protein